MKSFQQMITEELSLLEKRIEGKMMAHLDSRVEAFEAKIQMKVDESLSSAVASLSATNNSTITTIDKSIDDLHRTNRLTDVIIRGVPLAAGEDAKSVVSRIAEVTKHVLSAHMDAFRIGKDGNRRGVLPIIARFSSRNEASAFIKSFRASGVKLCDIGFSSDSGIYEFILVKAYLLGMQSYIGRHCRGRELVNCMLCTPKTVLYMSRLKERKAPLF